jgi:MFS transporter, ACS family, glucarate transporter
MTKAFDGQGTKAASTATPIKPTHTRFWLIAFLFLITTINYADRSTFSIAGSAASVDLGLSPVQMGFILSAFGWAYVIAQIPGGALLDRFGVKRVYVGAIALWSIFTAFQGLTGLLGGFSIIVTLFILRFMVGLAEAPSFPGNARIVAAWFPAAERGTASAIFNSAQYFAIVAFAPLISAGARCSFSWVLWGYVRPMFSGVLSKALPITPWSIRRNWRSSKPAGRSVWKPAPRATNQALTGRG